MWFPRIIIVSRSRSTAVVDMQQENYGTEEETKGLLRPIWKPLAKPGFIGMLLLQATTIVLLVVILAHLRFDSYRFPSEAVTSASVATNSVPAGNDRAASLSALLEQEGISTSASFKMAGGACCTCKDGTQHRIGGWCPWAMSKGAALCISTGGGGGGCHCGQCP